MHRPYLKICDWDLIFGLAVKTIFSTGVHSPCLSWLSYGMKVSMEWHESLCQGTAYSVTLLPAFGCQQVYRIMPCPSEDFFVTPRRPNQSLIQNGTWVKKINFPNAWTPFNHCAGGKPYSSGRSWTELREHSRAWRKNKESAENLATSLV